MYSWETNLLSLPNWAQKTSSCVLCLQFTIYIHFLYLYHRTKCVSFVSLRQEWQHILEGESHHNMSSFDGCSCNLFQDSPRSWISLKDTFPEQWDQMSVKISSSPSCSLDATCKPFVLFSKYFFMVWLEYGHKSSWDVPQLELDRMTIS